MSLSAERLRVVLVLAGVNVLLVAAGWLLLVGPQRHDAANAAQQVQQTQTEIADAAKPAATKQSTFRTGELYRLAQAMPSSMDESDLLLSLDQLAQASGVRVVNISPQQPGSGAGYETLPIDLTVQGSYAKLTAFLHRLRTMVALHDGQVVASGRLFSVTSVGLTAPTTGTQLTATVSLDAFVYGSVSGAPTATGQTDTTATTTTTSG